MYIGIQKRTKSTKRIQRHQNRNSKEKRKEKEMNIGIQQKKDYLSGDASEGLSKTLIVCSVC